MTVVFIDSPEDRIVSMIQYKDRIYLATEHRVYVKNDDGVFEPLKFAYIQEDEPEEEHANSSRENYNDYMAEEKATTDRDG